MPAAVHSSYRLARWLSILTLIAGPGLTLPVPAADVPTLTVTNDLTLEAGAILNARLVVAASHITIDGRGATLVGPGTPGDPASLENAGVGVAIAGGTGVTVRDLKVKGFATGLHIRDSSAFRIVQCDFSDNYHNPAHGWGELPARGGILIERSHHGLIEQCRANRVWDALHLIDSDDHLIQDNDFSHCSNTCGKLWHARRNRWLRNNLSYGIRIDRAAGEVHARDSTCVLIETGSDDNYFYRNDITHGGDGLFVRVLNGWVSRGNVFIENDCSYANNNCIESWSPGNTYIRNRANHGSYGFWLGGSDQTVLIGNEAAFNGRPDGFHQAPEPGFGHGGIVIVSGSSSHTVIEGNDCHDNHGAGLVFRGDVGSQGRRWRTHHWIVQQNRFANNRWGIWGRWGDWIHLANNIVTNNPEGNYLEDVSRLRQPASDPSVTLAPRAVLRAPLRAAAGQPVEFDARDSVDPAGRALTFDWHLGDATSAEALVRHRYNLPGYYRVGLTVHNGVLAALAYRDLIVADLREDPATEGRAVDWTFDLEGNGDGRGRVLFADDPDAVVGRTSLRFRPDPYPGAYATVWWRQPIRTASDAKPPGHLRFWLRAENPNLPGFQNPGPVVTLVSANGRCVLKPVQGRNLVGDPPQSEARWCWRRFVVPFETDADWERTLEGEFSPGSLTGLGIALDSWGGDPFTIWLDGLALD